MTMRKIALMLIAVLSLNIGMAQDTEELRNEMRKQLNETDDADKKVELMYNLFDIAPKAEATNIAISILNYADSVSNDELSLEMLCQLAFLNVRNDSLLQDLSERVMRYPDSDKKKMVRTYVNLRRAGNLALYSTDGERLERIKQIVQSDYFDNNADRYERIELLGTVCMLLGSNTTHSGMLVSYVDRLVEIADQLKDDDIYLRNLIYNYSSNLYTNIGYSEKAVNAARKRIETLEHMTEKFHDEKRIYYNFDLHFLQAYRILLSNFEQLSLPEVDEYYAKIEHLVKTNEDVREEFEKGSPTCYYLIAHEKYQEAIPYLEKYLDSVITNFARRHGLRYLIMAAKKTNNTDLQLSATTQYVDLLEELMANDAASSEAEMKINYEVSSLESEAVAKEKEQHERMIRILVLVGIAAFIAIAIISLLYRRSNKLSKQLKASNEEMKNESETLRLAQDELIKARDKATKAERHKTEFISNISHEIITPVESIVEYTQLIVDCTDAEKNKYLSKYADIVKLNAELFLNLVNDIFEINMLEAHNLKVKKQPVSINEICHMASDSFKSHLKPDVKFIFKNEGDSGAIIVTDAKRVEQVIINMLINAAKFTEKGQIELAYEIDRENNEVTFSVTDTGIGIPEGKQEEIFERFAKLDKQSQGVGLGLSVSRMIAELLQGTIKVDMSYKKGARFVFTIPMS